MRPEKLILTNWFGGCHSDFTKTQPEAFQFTRLRSITSHFSPSWLQQDAEERALSQSSVGRPQFPQVQISLRNRSDTFRFLRLTTGQQTVTQPGSRTYCSLISGSTPMTTSRESQQNTYGPMIKTFPCARSQARLGALVNLKLNL